MRVTMLLSKLIMLRNLVLVTEARVQAQTQAQHVPNEVWSSWAKQNHADFKLTLGPLYS